MACETDSSMTRDVPYLRLVQPQRQAASLVSQAIGRNRLILDLTWMDGPTPPRVIRCPLLSGCPIGRSI